MGPQNNDIHILPVRGRVFADVIDGYFPLQESLRQMLVRNGFGAAWVELAHAPAMEIPDLALTDPVPLYITSGFGCMIRAMSIIVRLQEHEDEAFGIETPQVKSSRIENSGIETSGIETSGRAGVNVHGVAKWMWAGGYRAGDRDFSSTHRLAEPAFIRGIGLQKGEVETQFFGPVAAHDTEHDTQTDIATDIAIVQYPPTAEADKSNALNQSSWSGGHIWVPSAEKSKILQGHCKTGERRVVMTAKSVEHRRQSCGEFLITSARLAEHECILNIFADHE